MKKKSKKNNFSLKYNSNNLKKTKKTNKLKKTI